MDKIKKMWKELSVFLIVIIAFVGLLVYKNIRYAEISTITTSKLESKMDKKDSFVVVVGKDSDETTSSYKSVMQTFVDKNRDKDLYYVDLTEVEDTVKYISEVFNTEETSIPHTFVVVDGEVKAEKPGSMTYYRLVELYNKVSE